MGECTSAAIVRFRPEPKRFVAGAQGKQRSPEHLEFGSVGLVLSKKIETLAVINQSSTKWV